MIFSKELEAFFTTAKSVWLRLLKTVPRQHEMVKKVVFITGVVGELQANSVAVQKICASSKDGSVGQAFRSDEHAVDGLAQAVAHSAHRTVQERGRVTRYNKISLPSTRRKSKDRRPMLL